MRRPVHEAHLAGSGCNRHRRQHAPDQLHFDWTIIDPHLPAWLVLHRHDDEARG
jgi:hypothetical protein